MFIFQIVFRNTFQIYSYQNYAFFAYFYYIFELNNNISEIKAALANNHLLQKPEASIKSFEPLLTTPQRIKMIYLLPAV